MPSPGFPVLQKADITDVGSPGARRRSVTGAPCRCLKDGNAVEKPTLSPDKLEAVGSYRIIDLETSEVWMQVKLPREACVHHLCCWPSSAKVMAGSQCLDDFLLLYALGCVDYFTLAAMSASLGKKTGWMLGRR